MNTILKHTAFLIILLFVSVSIFAQAPQGIPYQAVARNSSGAILASTAIRVRFTIHDSIATGTIVFRETFNPTTSAQGLFNVNVGTGTVVSGTFSGINWGTNAKFMQVEIDPAGGTSYIDMGSQQMMSVPYALYAGNFTNSPPQGMRLGYSYSNTWTCPVNVFQITVQLWGGGGGGGMACSYAWAGTGGYGGYNKAILSVIPGATYNIVIGTGGSGTSYAGGGYHPAQSGQSSNFNGILIAAGGGPGMDCSSINGTNGVVVNYLSSLADNGSNSVIPSGYLTAVPNCCEPGGHPGDCAPNCPGTGTSGYCVISY